jgi:NADPH:quinone reductase-like Zn-dependent oxidoreductase
MIIIMKAIVYTKYGQPEVLKPIPKNNEVLIKIWATTAASGDCVVRGAWLPMQVIFGFRKPRKSILGVVLAGEVEALGK